MKSLLICGIAVLLTVAAANGQSKDWKVLDFSSDDKGITGYFTYQPDTVIKSEPHTFKAWLKYGDIKKRTEKTMLFELRCTKRQFRPLAILIYSLTSGKLISQKHDTHTEWDNIVPDSVVETFYSKVCTDFDL